MTGHAAVVPDNVVAPMRAGVPKKPKTAGSSAVVNDSADAPMRAGGPKRPNRKLISIRFKQVK